MFIETLFFVGCVKGASQNLPATATDGAFFLLRKLTWSFVMQKATSAILHP